MKYLVTGGAGFIGSNVALELLNRGHAVRILDNFATGRRENLQGFAKRTELIEGDVRTFRTVREAVDGVDFVLHQAALPSVPRSIQDPITTNQVNVEGTLNVLNAAVDVRVKRVVYASSSSIYGDSKKLPKQEDMIPNPLSPYAVSKLAGEKYCQVFSGIHGLHITSLRYFNVFGPRQDPNSQYSAVIPKFIKAMLNDTSPLIYGDGQQTRDFTFVKNVTEANILATEIDTPSGLVLNCACQERIGLDHVVATINKILHKNIRPEYGPPRPGDIKHSFADIERIGQYLKYVPVVLFEEGLQQTIGWYQTHLDP
jgi:nucleoside-diphosphate-sugar epimerase